jgi:sugar lactone lactonase YvrE
VRITGPAATNRKIIANGLKGPLGLAWAGADAVYVSESGGGQVSRVDLKTGARSVAVSKLEQPEGVAVAPDGALLVVEVAAKRLTRIDPKSGARSIIAANLPIGLGTGPSLYRSVAASLSAIYINSDIQNAIYKITPKK